MKAELDEGVIRMTAGGTRDHSRVQINLATAGLSCLRGSGCRPYGSDMAVQTHEMSVRYPDLSIDCGASGDQPDDLVLSDPRAIVEVLSPSTRRSDLGVKAKEYRTIASVQTVAFIDVEKEPLSVNQRFDGGWTETLFAASDLHIPSLNLTISHTEIFARD